MTDFTKKLSAIVAGLKAFEKRLLEGGLDAEDKASFGRCVAELQALIDVPAADVEVPRLVKKPGGETKRVETREELDVALADGWAVRLPAPVDEAPVDEFGNPVGPIDPQRDALSGPVGDEERQRLADASAALARGEEPEDTRTAAEKKRDAKAARDR